MREQSVTQQVNAELTEYFEQARQVTCPPDMKQNLYQELGLVDSRRWLKPAMAFSVMACMATGLIWNVHQDRQLAAAERDMQIAMHYMQKISNKTLEETNTHGIKPAIIVPVSKSMAQI